MGTASNPYPSDNYLYDKDKLITRRLSWVYYISIPVLYPT